MATRRFTPPRMAAIEELRLKPVTDPAEWADLDRRFRAAPAQGPHSPEGLSEPGATVSVIEELIQKLPAGVRLELLTRLAAELPCADQCRLAEGLAAGATLAADERSRKRTGGRPRRTNGPKQRRQGA